MAFASNPNLVRLESLATITFPVSKACDVIPSTTRSYVQGLAVLQTLVQVRRVRLVVRIALVALTHSVSLFRGEAVMSV